MKEKPPSFRKGSKKGKKDSSPPPEVEPTPKQLKEKRREEARAKAAETRKIVTAGVSQWTGKLPAQLLNEHAQKMKWERVEYPLKSFGKEPDQEWVASVILARKNPKSKEIEKVRFDPPSNRVSKQPTQVEAKNLAATYCLHRILSHRNMKMMLPPPHRDLWSQLDSDKSNSKPYELYMWNEDPWQQVIKQKELKVKLEAERAERLKRHEQMEILREAENEAKVKETAQENVAKLFKAKHVKFNNTLIMSRKIRAVIEQIIRQNDGFKFSTNDALDPVKDPEKYTKITKMLQKLGFNANFIAEALEYTSQLSSALTWLLIHVPEDDMPASFMPTEIGGMTARVSSSIQVESVTSKLRDFGYSEDLARSTAEQYDGSLSSCVIALSSKFLPENSDPYERDLNKEQQDVENDFWSEEVNSLHAIVDNDQLFISGEKNSPSCTLVSKSANFKLTFFKSPDYPNSLPGIAVEPLSRNGLSKVSQLEATRQAVCYANANLLGSYTMITLFQQLEETFSDIVDNPSKLSQISSGVIGVDETKLRNEEAEIKQVLLKKLSFKRTRSSRSFDAERISQENAKRMTTPAGKDMLRIRSSLPAWEKQAEIANLVRDHQIVLITGETGSGKSTQTVQFILDSVADAQIICTQPRRISAIGVAQRVADERLLPIGEQVGYVIRGESKVSSKTQLRFVTNGVLLRMLQEKLELDSTNTKESICSNNTGTSLDLDGVTHIFVDEVHERSLDSDFLLILLKHVIERNSKVKIVLMSATLDPDRFFKYFSPCKVGYTHIKGRTFPVEQFYLDDIIKKTGYLPVKSNNPTFDDDNQDDGSNDMSIGKIIGSIRTSAPGHVDFNLVASTVQYVHSSLEKRNDTDGSILIFMSGADEIDRTLRAIKTSSVGSCLWALPLHASLPPTDQRKVFQTAPKGLRKVIVSTNVAETSITISDIVAVIDSGRVKETVYDAEANVSRLVDVWISKAAATQRKGRAGRVKAGICFKLYTENAEQRMHEYALPEILRSPLEVLYLNVKAMGISDVGQFLSKAIDPPAQMALDTAKQNLITYGVLDALNNELTALGKHISRIPTDIRTAKLLVLAVMMGCLPKCATIASIMSIGKLPFRTEKDNSIKNSQIFSEFGGENGDLIAACKAYEQWDQGTIDKSLISVNICRDIRSTRRQLLGNLVQIGFLNEDESELSYAKHNDSDATVRALISAALQPNVSEISFPQQKYLSTSTGNIQKEGIDDSRAIKFFSSSGTRVFIHPRSLLFGQTTYINASKYLSFGSSIVTNKHFISENTPISVYGLALFASRIDVDPLGNGIIIDKWTGLKCWPRAGILLQFLQRLMGRLMDEKFRNPSTNTIEHPVIQLVHDLLESEGRPEGIGLVA